MVRVKGKIETTPSKSKYSTVKAVLRVLLSVGLLVVLFGQFGLQETIATLASANKLLLLLSVVLYFLGTVVSSYRWQGLVSAFGTRVPLRTLIPLYFVGSLFNNLLPGSVSGDVAKAYHLSRRIERTDAAVSSVVMDRLIGILALFAIASAGVVFGYDLVSREIALATITIAAAMWGGVWFVSNKTVWRWLRQRVKLLDRLAETKIARQVVLAAEATDRRVAIRALAISFLLHMIWIGVRYVIAEALGVHISVWYFIIFIPLITLATTVPLFFGGLGVRETAYVYLFTQVGVPAPLCISMSLALYALRLVGATVGGLIYAFGVADRS